MCESESARVRVCVGGVEGVTRMERADAKGDGGVERRWRSKGQGAGRGDEGAEDAEDAVEGGQGKAWKVTKVR